MQQQQQPSMSQQQQRHTYSIRDRQILSQRISELGPTEHNEIFSIINQHAIEYTRNKNGVFVNMTTMTNEVIHTINQFVCFCHDNKLNLDEYDKRLNECKFLCTRHDVSSTQSKKNTDDVHVTQQQRQQQPSISKIHASSSSLSSSLSTTANPLPPQPSHPSQDNQSVVPNMIHDPGPGISSVQAKTTTTMTTNSSIANQSAFKQAVKRFSRKQRANDSFPDDYGDITAHSDTLTPDPVLIP